MGPNARPFTASHGALLLAFDFQFPDAPESRQCRNHCQVLLAELPFYFSLITLTQSRITIYEHLNVPIRTYSFIIYNSCLRDLDCVASGIWYAGIRS